MASSKKAQYPHRMAVVYLSAVTLVMSTVLAIMLLLQTPALLFSYFAVTFIIATATFSLKSFLLRKALNASENDAQYEENTGWKKLIQLFFLLFGFLFVPLLLAGVLDPYVWFIFIMSLSSGFSVAELWLYFRLR